MTTERKVTWLLNGKRVIATVRPSEQPDHNICSVTISHRFEPGEFNRLFSDTAARMLWARAWRAARVGEYNDEGALFFVAARMYHVNNDTLRLPWAQHRACSLELMRYRKQAGIWPNSRLPLP